MLSPSQLEALGVEAGAASRVQKDEFVLAHELVDASMAQDRFGGDQSPGADEALEMLTLPIAPEHPLSEDERALRTALLAEAAGVLGLELTLKGTQG